MAEFILKDWYGKEKSFDHETVYFQDAEGNLLPFTHGTGNPVLEPLEVTENGTYTAPDGVDGYSPVTVNVPAPEIKLQDKTITENGEYTADDGFDGLGKVLVEIASSSSGELLFKKTSVKPQTSSGVKTSVDIGFVPDCLLVYLEATSVSLAKTRGVTYFGISTALKNKLGLAVGINQCLECGATSYVSGMNVGIEQPYAYGRPLTEADENGFTLGQRAPFDATYAVVAIGGLT